MGHVLVTIRMTTALTMMDGSGNVMRFNTRFLVNQWTSRRNTMALVTLRTSEPGVVAAN